MAIKNYSFIAQVYKQGANQTPILSFCAPADAIFRFGGVPSKTERFHGGFQRALSDRYRKVEKFFDDGQISPTSVVLAFRPGAITMNEIVYPESAWPAKSNLSSIPKFCLVEFELESYDADTTDLNTLIERTSALLVPRLTGIENDNGNGDSKNDEDEELDEQQEENDGLESNEDDEDEDIDTLDVGHSKLKEFYDFIKNPEAIEKWLVAQNEKYNSIKSKKNLKKAEQEFVAITPEQRLKQSLISLLRPAMIVDGQHRVNGAYNSTQSPIFFSVCAIPEADWIEQVFQFVILNKMAKPISKGFLSGLLNTSLTNKEISDIEDRLQKVGINNTDRILLRSVNFDDSSPFHNMVSQPGEVAGADNLGKLSDKGMIRLARKWYALNNQNNKAVFTLFSKALGGKNITENRSIWNKEWENYFFGFWTIIRSLYEPDGIWEKNENFSLLMIVTLHELQDYFLDTKAENGQPFENKDDFQNQVKAFYEPVTGQFFRSWKKTGLQSGDGPDIVRNALKSLRGGAKLSEVLKTSPLFSSEKKS